LKLKFGWEKLQICFDADFGTNGSKNIYYERLRYCVESYELWMREKYLTKLLLNKNHWNINWVVSS
jgi:hypothetical protein